MKSQIKIDSGSVSEEEEERKLRVLNKPKTKPEYLRPMRIMREDREGRMGKDKEVNWKAVIDRAKGLTRTTPRSEAYFSHTGRGGEVKDSFKDKTRYKQ